jgi:F420-dependent oxidoreductase-like protein
MDLRIFVEPQEGASYEDQLTLARAAESSGFGGFFRSDHFLAIGGADGLPGPTDSWVTLAGLARQTRTIRLGTLVSSATFRSPGLLAVQVAQVDAMSGGRVELGLGTGWFEAEHAAYGFAFPELGERFDRLAEQLEIVTGLWSTPVGERFSYPGRHYRLTDSPALPKPVQERVPVIVGGAGPRRTPALAARFATEFNVGFVAPRVGAERFARVHAACAEIGRDPADLDRSVALTTVVGRDDAEVRRRCDAFGGDLDELVTKGLAGSPAQVVDRLGQWADVGAGRVYLQIRDLADLDLVELIASEVMPHVGS